MTEEKYESIRKLLITICENLDELSSTTKIISERPLIDPRGLSEISLRLENLAANINYLTPQLARHALETALEVVNGEKGSTAFKKCEQKMSSSEIVDNLLNELKNKDEGKE